MDDKTLQTIQDYLEGNLNSQEVEDFESQLANDTELSDQVRIISQLDSVLFEDASLASDFNSENDRAQSYFEFFNNDENKAFYEELKQIDVQSTVKKRHWIGRIAGIAAVFVGGLLAWNMFLANPSDDKLFAKYSDYSGLPSGVEKSGANDAIAKAEELFQKEDFKQAAAQYQQALESGNNEEITRLKYAISLAENGDLSEAILQIESITIDSNSLFQGDAAFFQGLFYIKQGSRQRAETSLSRVPEESKRYDDAKKLLSLIK